MARARDIIAHHYFALEDEILWEVTQTHVPHLLTQLGPIILDEESRPES
jgi:uncharacterized protein with HEPN domain